MDPNVVNQVVDKLAEKIGIAADKLAPVATEAIRQVSALGSWYCLMASVCAVVVLICAGQIQRAAAAYYEEHGPAYGKDALCAARVSVCVFIGLLLFFVGIRLVAEGLPRWIAPLAYLLGK